MDVRLSIVFPRVILPITTKGAGVAATRLPGSNRQFQLYATLLPVIGLAGSVTGMRKRKSARWAVRLGTVTAIMFVAGCGGHSPPPPGGFTPGRHTPHTVSQQSPPPPH